MAYNRDLQEDKPPLWMALNEIDQALDVMAGIVETMNVNKERLAELSGANFTILFGTAVASINSLPMQLPPPTLGLCIPNSSP